MPGDRFTTTTTTTNTTTTVATDRAGVGIARVGIVRVGTARLLARGVLRLSIRVGLRSLIAAVPRSFGRDVGIESLFDGRIDVAGGEVPDVGDGGHVGRTLQPCSGQVRACPLEQQLEEYSASGAWLPTPTATMS